MAYEVIEPKRKLSLGKLLNIFFLLVIITAIPLTVFVAQQRQEVRQRAAEIPSGTRATNIVALGDSITFAAVDCTSSATSSCVLGPNTYLYLYASSVLPNGSVYSNYAYSGTTASCVGACPTTDPIITPDATHVLNSYINKDSILPNNQSGIIQVANMAVRYAPGLARSQMGQFDNFTNSEVIIAWGRNDIPLSIDQYKNAINSIANRIKTNPTNIVTFLTIPPMSKNGWAMYQPFSVRRHDFDDRITDQSYPKELDTFFSAKVWEVAYETDSYIVPFSEYMMKFPHPEYFSSDEIHPTSAGHKLIADLIKTAKGKVQKKGLETISINSKFVIRSTQPVYGQIISNKNGQFYYSEQFYVDESNPYIGSKLTNDVSVYSNTNITIDNFSGSTTSTPSPGSSPSSIQHNIIGKIWIDTNKNGLYDASIDANYLGGATVTLKNLSTSATITATTSTTDGNYYFWNLPNGQYSVILSPISGYTFTSPNNTNPVPIGIDNNSVQYSWVNYSVARATSPSPTSTPTSSVFTCTACAADIKKDSMNRVNAADYAVLASCYGKSLDYKLSNRYICANADVNKDGKINESDYS
ncbi:MAG: SdrD B-like domain-containing protein, partial [Candidatus Levybacteria bacterium]|nr:SdrD B-like domain-containing protein [Candidatus Levybacteria bacterium]